MKRSRGSLGPAGHEQPQPAGGCSAGDPYRDSLTGMKLFISGDFRHHRINENVEFPTEIFLRNGATLIISII
jgi:hypothetical protein